MTAASGASKKRTYTGRTRDAYRVGLAGITGVTTVAALGGTGWLAGVAAADAAQQQADKLAAQHRAEELWWRTHPPAPKIKTVWKKRKYVTRIAKGAVPATTYVGGGTVSSGGGGGHSGGGGGNAPKPPSSGS